MMEDHFILLIRFSRKTLYVEGTKFTGRTRNAGANLDRRTRQGVKRL